MLLAKGGRLRDRMLQLALGPLPASLGVKVNRMAESFITGLGIFHRWRELALVSISSLVAWGSKPRCTTWWRAFGGQIEAAMGVRNDAHDRHRKSRALVPSSPGYVGPYEAAVILVLSGALGLKPRAGAFLWCVGACHALASRLHHLGGVIEVEPPHLSLRQVEAAEYSWLEPEADTDASELQLDSPDRRWRSAAFVAPHELIEAIILGIAQGLTEVPCRFRPPGHLIIIPGSLAGRPQDTR
ncbi:MAG: hypothetical protein R2855_13945 [Thermomicrobiales bacterium]